MNKLNLWCRALGLAAIMTTSLWSAEGTPTTLKFSTLAAPVQKTFRSEAPTAKIESVTEETDGGMSVYVAYVSLDGDNYGVKVAKDGTLVAKTLDLDVKVSETEIKLSDAPPPAQKTIQEETKGGAINTVLKTMMDGKPVYGAGASIKDKVYWITVSEDGTLLEKRLDLPVDEEEIELSQCPPAVRDTLTEEARGGKFLTVSKASVSGKSVYRIDVALGGKNYEIVAEEDGTLIAKKLGIEPERSLIQFSDCPPAVQKTLRAAVDKAQIDKVAKETDDGKSFFRVVLKMGGKSYEIQVAEDGRLMSKALVRDDAEGGKR